MPALTNGELPLPHHPRRAVGQLHLGHVQWGLKEAVVVPSRVYKYHIGTMVNLVVLTLAGNLAEGRIQGRRDAMNFQQVSIQMSYKDYHRK